MPPRKVMAIKKTIGKQKKKHSFVGQKKKSKANSDLARLISEATCEAFKNNGNKNKNKKKIATKRSIVQKSKKIRNKKKRSPSTSTTCTEETTSQSEIDESLSPSISSQDSKNETTIKKRNRRKYSSESHSSKYVDSELDSNEYNKDEVLSFNVGSTFKNGRYKVERKLGYGAFSTVWLAWDQQDNKYVALKIQNCSKDCIKAAQKEIKIHKKVVADKLTNEKAVVKLLDHFEHIALGNHKHICMVFEYLGDNLLTLIKANKYKGLPLEIVKNLATQILTGLNYLHKDLKIIHTDLKPENVLLMFPLDPCSDPRLSFGGTPIVTKRQRFSTPTPSKLQQNLNSFQIESLGTYKYEHNSNGENLSQSSSKVGSRPTTPTHIQRIGNALNNANTSSKLLEFEEGQVTSEPESLDRLAIDSDPDIARNLDVHNKAKVMPENQNQCGTQQVKFTMPHNGQSSKSNKSLNPFDYEIKCKIVDLGTACQTNKVFMDDIQTRPYRCPEVLLGCKYSTSADMWSFGCLVFELATGSILFDPQTGGSEYNRDEDHLAQIVEILGPIPKNLIAKGTHSHDYLTKDGELKRRKPRGHSPLHKLLMSEYRFNEKDAKELAGFLLPLLELAPNKRPTADQCLHHPWLKNP